MHSEYQGTYLALMGLRKTTKYLIKGMIQVPHEYR